jgi:hypothetical protein
MFEVAVRHLRTNVVAYLALFVALAGTAYAANTIGSADVIDESLTGADIKGKATPFVDGTLTGQDVKDGTILNADIGSQALSNSKIQNNAITGGKVLDNSLTGSDIDESTLVGAGSDATSVNGVSVNGIDFRATAPPTVGPTPILAKQGLTLRATCANSDFNEVTVTAETSVDNATIRARHFTDAPALTGVTERDFDIADGAITIADTAGSGQISYFRSDGHYVSVLYQLEEQPGSPTGQCQFGGHAFSH